jgi:hypothetical protein
MTQEMTYGNDMTRNESLERFKEGLKIAADRCRELGKQTNSVMWGLIATNLDQLRAKGEKIVLDKGLTQTQILKSVDNFQERRRTAAEAVENAQKFALKVN